MSVIVKYFRQAKRILQVDITFADQLSMKASISVYFLLSTHPSHITNRGLARLLT